MKPDYSINPCLDPDTLAATFREQNQVVIDQFLAPETAETLHRFFADEMPKEWWTVTSRPHISGQDKPHFIRNIEHNAHLIRDSFDAATAACARGEFAYHFMRTQSNHYDRCDCAECRFRAFLGSGELLDFISEVTNRARDGIRESFASRYDPGSFLAPHDDANNGSLTFVLQLTKNWQSQWGGLLHFLDDEGSVVQDVLVPAYNSLLLFDLPADRGRRHCVSQVAPDVPELRLSYTGWF